MVRRKQATPVAATGRSKIGIDLANLRQRAKRELKRLATAYGQLSEAQQRGTRGREIRSIQEEIETQIERTKLGRKVKGQFRTENLLRAREAQNALNSLIGPAGTAGGRSKAQQEQERRERLDRIFRHQIRTEASGGEGRYHGKAGDYMFEKIFYMSTQGIWSGSNGVAGLSNQMRDKAIIKALGVDTLEEAYKKVLRENKEVFKEMKQLHLQGVAWEDMYKYLTALVEDIRDRVDLVEIDLEDYRE